MADFKLLSQSRSPVYDRLSGDADQIFAENIAASIEGEQGFCLVAVVDSVVCGFLMGSVARLQSFYDVNQVGHISDLFIADGFRRQGAGTALLRAGEEEFASRGCETPQN